MALGDVQAVYYRPETLMAYDIGYRGQIAKGLSLDADAFYYDYRDMQLASIQVINALPQLVVTNAGKARVIGLEAAAHLTPARDVVIALGLDLIDAHYLHFCPGGTPSGSPQGACAPGTPDFAGRKLDRSPAQTFFASYSWTVPLASGAALSADIGTRMKAASAITAFGPAPVQFFVPAHTTTHISLTYTAAKQRFYLAAYVKNLENFIELASVDPNSALPASPRTYGVRAGARF